MAASTPNPSPNGTAGEPPGADPAKSKLRRWVGELSRGAKWLLGVVIVALVGALVTGVVAGWLSPSELGAELSDVSIDRNVTLNEFAIRHESNSASTPRRDMVVALAPYVVAQTAPEDGTTPEGDTTPGDNTTSDDNTTTEDNTTTDDNTATDDNTTTDGDESISGVRLSDQDRRHLQTGVEQALADTPTDLDIGRACREDANAPNCGLGSLTTVYLKMSQAAPVSAEAVAGRMAKVFAGTRTQPSASDPGKRQLVGVTVNFNISMTGFSDGQADVRWSLYSTGAGGAVPRDWLRSQRALSLRAEADKDSASGEFWVPLPRVKGAFFIRLGVYDEDDTRLDYANTPRFH